MSMSVDKIAFRIEEVKEHEEVEIEELSHNLVVLVVELDVKEEMEIVEEVKNNFLCKNVHLLKHPNRLQQQLQ